MDLSTGPARLAGGGASHPTNPDDAGFSRLSIFGGDTLTSAVQAGFGNGTVPGGWPNGRRFGDDVARHRGDGAHQRSAREPADDRRVRPATTSTANDIAYNKVFPYAATPLNGRNAHALRRRWHRRPSASLQRARRRPGPLLSITLALRRPRRRRPCAPTIPA